MTKPIAWMASNELLFSVVKDEIYHIPLYTHPMRELTDEEIKKVYGKYFDVKNCDWLHLECIRAILKKASEK